MWLKYCSTCKRETQQTGGLLPGTTILNYRCSVCFNATIVQSKKKEDDNMIVLIKSSIGTFMGKNEINVVNDIYRLRYSCMIDFITMPVQGRIGQPTIATMRQMVAWPIEVLELHLTKPYGYSIVHTGSDGDSSQIDDPFLELYLKTVKEAWPKAVFSIKKVLAC